MVSSRFLKDLHLFIQYRCHYGVHCSIQYVFVIDHYNPHAFVLKCLPPYLPKLQSFQTYHISAHLPTYQLALPYIPTYLCMYWLTYQVTCLSSHQLTHLHIHQLGYEPTNVLMLLHTLTIDNDSREIYIVNGCTTIGNCVSLGFGTSKWFNTIFVDKKWHFHDRRSQNGLGS